ncbi:MAG: hypothetical protein GXY96_06905 [Tissierellia bacterium]|nr:hypothetical protein [Tissierellia bacterium]
MIRHKQLITLDLIEKESGKSIGKIEDVVYSKDGKKIEYIIVKNNNLFRNKLLIPYDKIRFLDRYQVLFLGDIDSYLNQVNIDIKNHLKLIDKVIKLENGEYLGYVKDIVINKKDGSIDGFIITEGLFEDLIKGRNYIPLLNNMRIAEEGLYLPDGFEM